MRKIRTKIQILATLMVAFTVTLTVAPVFVWALRDSDARIEKSLTVRRGVFDELMRARAQQMQQTVRLASQDPAFAAAVGNADLDALPALLAERGEAATGDLALLLDLDGKVLAASEPLDPPRLTLPGIVSRAGELGLSRSPLTANGQTFEMVTVPVRAPLPVGWLAVGYVIDEELAQTIQSLTGLYTTVYRTDGSADAILGSTLDAETLGPLMQGLRSGRFVDNDILKLDLPNSHLMAVQRNFLPQSSAVTIMLKESVRDIAAPYRQLRLHAVAVAALAAMLALLGAAFLARRIGEPMYELVSAARRIREGDYSTPVTVTSEDELAELAVSFNAMQEGIADREERITYQAQYDELTGLPNRFLGLERLAAAIDSAAQTNESVSVLMIDLNSLTDIGSSLGQEIGDALLGQAAERLRASLDSRFVLARLEVDAFLAVLPGVDHSGAVVYAEELRRLLSAGLAVRDLNVSLDASVGISCFPDHGDNEEKLLLRATVAKNDAKDAQTNIGVYEDGREDLHVRHVAILGDLARAVREDELKVFMQPKVNLADGRICGAEALVRWDHPTLGFLPPNEFIPLAEQSGNISIISRWALTAAIRECRLWQEDGLELNVSVNLSGRDLQNTDLPCAVSELLRDHDLDARKLVLEITEQALVRDIDDARRVLECLRDLGAKIAIDDFGTGYSSLVQIKNLPVDEVKIDRAFVTDLPGNRADVAIVRAAIELAHSLGLDVLAEGVESRATMRWLAAHGCERAQGFLIARPMPAEQFPDWLAEYNEQLEARVESGHAEVDHGFAAGAGRRLRTAG
ncbi:MAG: GGDEF domain-containing protein [Chromatiales bacterium]|nr:MAG: GGDEF domain-containing protein [Chromatiales bacterium]